MALELPGKSQLSIPSILYGTAWKEDNTERLVTQALTLGFMGIDTANLPWLSTPYMQEAAIKYNKTIPQIIFRFATHLGMLPLTGTTSSQHMNDDLTINDFELTPKEIHLIETMAVD